MSKRIVVLLLLFGFVATGCGSKPDKPAKPSNITVKNNKVFAALLAGPDHADAIDAFSNKYRKKTVAFDGFIDKHYYSSQSDDSVIIRAGTVQSPTGPRFSISEDDAPTVGDMKDHQSVHVIAKVGVYDHDASDDTATYTSDLTVFYLVPKVVRAEQ